MCAFSRTNRKCYSSRCALCVYVGTDVWVCAKSKIKYTANVTICVINKFNRKIMYTNLQNEQITTKKMRMPIITTKPHIGYNSSCAIETETICFRITCKFVIIKNLLDLVPLKMC